MAAATTTKEIAIAPTMRTGNHVAAIVPSTWAEVVTIASSICRAGMAPKSYLDKQGNAIPDKVAVAIMHGLEVGFTPMAALQSIAVINGMPSVYGDGLLALIRASGLLEDCEEFVEWGPNNSGPVSATCKMWRKGEKTPSIQTYTRADAENAKLWGKQGPWSDHPARMLQWRARGWCGRDKFADVLRGLRSAEEVEDMIDITPKADAPPEPKRSDYVEQPSPPADSPPSGTGGSGQPGTPQTTGASGDSQPEVAGTPAPVTDVEDLSDAPQETAFEHYKKIGDFFTFSDTFLQDPKRTVAEAEAWELFYREYLAEKGQHKNEKIREAVADTLELYTEVLKLGREPGEDG